MKLKPFKSGERICFIGDSITAATRWIAHIADYYASHTDESIEIYPCGIAGGNCSSGINYLQDQTAPWSPTTAVIMFGMNDISRGKYSPNATQEEINLQGYFIDQFEENLIGLTQKIKTELKVSRIIYLAPTPYDEMQECLAENCKGCQAALRKCAQIMQNTAGKLGGEFFDLGGEMFDLLSKAYDIGNQNPLINADRVHPSELGHSVMARIFLTAQGFDELSVSAEDVRDGKANLMFSDKVQSFLDAARDLQNRWTTDFQLGGFSPDKSKEGKLKFIKEEYLPHPERYGDYLHYGKYFVSLAEGYESLVLAEEENMKKLALSVKRLFER